MPTAESSALDTTIGMSICSAMSSSLATPPSGATFSTAMSAAPSRTTCNGSSALRMLSSAAIGTSTRRRSSASSGTVAHGCSRYSSGPSAVSALRRLDGLVDGPAAVRVHPHRRHQCANGVDPRDVVGECLARLGDLHLGGACAGEAGQHLGHLVGGDGGHGGVDRDAVAERRRRLTVGGFDARGEPMRGLGGSYSRNAPNSPQPAGPSISATSRTVMPRKRTRIGSATTCRRSSRSSSGGITERVPCQLIPSRGRGPPSTACADPS